MQNLKQTPLFREHRDLGAQMAPFAGWLMPIQYSGILVESRWCRESAALFDISHMGAFSFKGDFGETGLERIFSFSLATIPVGRCRYGFLLNEAGGIIDDLVVFRLSGDELMMVVNAGTTDKDFQAIRSGLRGDALFEDNSAATGKLGIQGPLSRIVLEEVCGVDRARLPFFGVKKVDIFGSEAVLSRTGYTGELGYEVYGKNDVIVECWRRFLADARVKPAGLGARDVLRLEMGYSLYGSDIDETTTPLEGGLGQFVDFSKDFIGRDALVRQRENGPERVKVALRVNSRRSPRHDYRIYLGDLDIGHVTSGVFSPTLGCGIGMGYVRPEAAAPGTALVISHETTSMEAVVTDLPFYKGGSLRK
jgi:aminomethyltransferase